MDKCDSARYEELAATLRQMNRVGDTVSHAIDAAALAIEKLLGRDFEHESWEHEDWNFEHERTSRRDKQLIKNLEKETSEQADEIERLEQALAEARRPFGRNFERREV